MTDYQPEIDKKIETVLRSIYEYLGLKPSNGYDATLIRYMRRFAESIREEINNDRF